MPSQVVTNETCRTGAGRRTPVPRAKWAVAAVAVVALAATACGTDTKSNGAQDPSPTTGPFPVTIEHNHGSTSIPEAPKRIVSVGYSDHDAVLAFGVVPVAVREFFGKQPDATWPWAQDELGNADPAVLDVAELNLETIASLKPDLIVGVSSGMKDDEYKRLSQIAPTLSRPTQFADYGVPWQDQTRVIGRALGKQARAEELVKGLEDRFATARKQHPAFGGRSAIVARPSTEPGQFFVFGRQDSRSRFLESLGFKIDAEAAKLAGEEFTATISTEQLELLNRADVVVWNVDSKADRDAVESNPIYQQLEMKRAGRDLFLDEQANAALSFSTVLSLPAALDTLVPQLATKTKPAAGGYTPVSDVSSHAAIGDDIAVVKKQLANVKEAKPVDWAAIKTAFTTGGASKKGDGTNRTLAGLVKAPEVVAYVNSAIGGGEGTDAVRAQRVEKGITGLLYLKILDEIEAGKTKLAAGKIDPKDGAPHNVDEAWAFYTANGNGVQSTAQKRGEDFKKPLDQEVLTALAATQTAAMSGDAAAFATAQGSVRSALNHVFYLATYKYLDTGSDAGKRAEGESFYLAIAPIVKKAAPEADRAISAAFASGDAKAGRAALNTPAVITALDLNPSQVIT